MIITRTPYRLSLFGGGSDYPEWYLKHGGEVLAGAIDKYCYLTLRWLPPFFAHRHRLVYSVVESVNEFKEIQHPAVRAVLESYPVQRGIELHHDGDLPARSGIGSSAAFAVGLIHAFRALQGLECDPWGLAREAIHLEQVLLGETTGSQDQVICSLGGFKHIRFHQSGDITAEGSERMAANIARLQSWLVLLYSGEQRSSSSVSQTLLPSFYSQSALFDRTVEMAGLARGLLEAGSEKDFAEMGVLMDETWQMKKVLNPSAVTTHIDDIYVRAMTVGAIGGKVAGAGGGGFMLFFVPPEKRDVFVRSMAKLALHVPFNFSNTGSEVIFRDLSQHEVAEYV